MTSKLEFLKSVNKSIDEKIKSLNNEINFKKSDGNKPKLKYEHKFKESYLKVYEFSEGMVSNFDIQNEFNRIILIEGLITIEFNDFTEDVILSPTNTYLISPDHSYTIKSSKKSTVIFISNCCNKKESVKNYELESIYIKNSNNE